MEKVVAEQGRIGALLPPEWTPGGTRLRVAAAVVVYERVDGADRDVAHEPAWAGAALVDGSTVVDSHVVRSAVTGPYLPGLLVLREGPLLTAAVNALPARPDVLLLAAAGRDHPRRAGLALQVGAALDLPTVGVTDRPLLARGDPPGPGRGESSLLLLDGAEVARWVRTASNVRPLVAHAAWRTTAGTAAQVVLECTGGARTPTALREARRLARAARAAATG